MTWLSLGSMALPFQLKTQGVQLRADIARLGEELTTGQVRDPSRHLRGDTGGLTAISAGLARTEIHLQNTRTATLRADTAQHALRNVETARARIAQDTLLAANPGTSAPMLTATGNSAAAALVDTVSSLSARVAGAALFSGVGTDRVPLVSADEMMDALTPVIAGMTDADAIADAIHAEFLNPGGLFETDFYRGDAAGPGATLGDGEAARSLPTAADPAIRSVLAGLATAALLADTTLPETVRHGLAQRATDQLLTAGGTMTVLQAEIGTVQAGLEIQQTRLLAHRDMLETGRQSLIGADPYESATRLQETQARLEALYTITARTARLSLTEYLR
jgi:flagellar hook-associated protein 3 FlgL